MNDKITKRISHYIIGASYDSSICVFLICIILICLCFIIKFMERRKQGYSGLKIKIMVNKQKR